MRKTFEKLFIVFASIPSVKRHGHTCTFAPCGALVPLFPHYDLISFHQNKQLRPLVASTLSIQFHILSYKTSTHLKKWILMSLCFLAMSRTLSISRYRRDLICKDRIIIRIHSLLTCACKWMSFQNINFKCFPLQHLH